MELYMYLATKKKHRSPVNMRCHQKNAPIYDVHQNKYATRIWSAELNIIEPINHLLGYIILIRCTPVPTKSVQTRCSTTNANFRWIFGTRIGFVEMCGVDIYIGRDLKCRGPPALQ